MQLFEALCTDEDVYVHYTDSVGLGYINEQGVIRPDGKGYVYFSRENFSQSQAHTCLFIGASTHAGRGSHIVVVRLDRGLALENCSYYEYRCQCSVRLDQHAIIYAGANPFKD